MAKYNIEGGISFYDALYSSLEQDDDNANVCLITNEQLGDRHFEMNCGHKFNYAPLYKDLVNHRKKFNSMESGMNVLSKSEIRCPYCREKHKGVLPYYEDMGFDLMEGVNAVYIKPVKCSFIWDNEYFDETSPEDDYNKTTIQCCQIGAKTVLPGSNETKILCGKHGKMILSKYAKEQKEIQKQDKLAAKLKEKQDKASAKAVAEADKALAKANADNKANAVAKSNASAKNATDENVILTSENWCVEILKSGDRKGQQCSSNKIGGQDRCKRHYNLLVKKNL